MAKGIIIGFVAIILTMELLAVGIPMIQTSGDLVNDTGVSGATLFSSTGLLPMVILFGGLVGMVVLAFSIFKGDK